MSLSRLDVLLREGDLERARLEIDGRLRRNPQDREALLGRARVKIIDNELPEAEKLLAQAETQGGEDALSRLVKAAVLAQKNQPEEAMAAYQAVLREAPERHEAHFGLGFLLADAERYEEAEAQLRQAVGAEPSSGVYRLHLARVLFEAERSEEALDHLQKAVELNPADIGGWLMLTVVMQELGDLESAEEVLQKGLAVLPKNPELMTALSNIKVAQGDFKGGQQLANQVAALLPNDPNARNNLARFLLAERNFDEALRICQTLKTAGTATPTTYIIEATALESRDPPDFDGAEAAYREAMRLDPRDWAPANNLGNLLMRRSQEEGKGDLQPAVDALEESRRRDPERAEPVLNLALAFARMGRVDDARALAQDLVDAGIPEHDEIGEQARRLLSKL